MNIQRAIEECFYVFAVTVHDFFFKPQLFSIFSCDFRSSECASFEKTVLFGSLGLPLAPLGYLRFPSWQRCTTMFNWHKATISKSNVSQSQKNDFKLNFWLKFDFCLPLLNSVLIYNCFLDSLVIEFAFLSARRALLYLAYFFSFSFFRHFPPFQISSFPPPHPQAKFRPLDSLRPH